MYWTAPPHGSGCVNFKAMVEERKDVWFVDYGSLTYTLCEDTSPLAEPPVSNCSLTATLTKWQTATHQ